ncbi:MAG: cell division protein FtsZ [Hylemonella sp.]|nr:cell division protein FtsZ [Hylemonella sp.]
MSKLQIGLAIVGALLLAAIVAHGAWISRRNQPRQAEPEGPPIEPHGLDEPSFATARSQGAPEDADGLMLPPQLERKPLLDPLIDISAAIELEHPVSGEALLQHMPATRRVGSKPYAIEGQDPATRQWEPPQAGRRYLALQAGVQLANRAGPLNEIEYSEFVVKTQALADALGGTPEFPDMRDAVARARELDGFASEHDAQLSVTLRARQTAWSAGYVLQNAARLGFVAGVLPGRMVLPANVGGQPPVLGLHYDAQAAQAADPAHTAIRDMTLTLDVAQVARSEQPYVRLREAATRLAEVMDGQITDDDGQPLSADAMDLIGAELENLYDKLDERELSAGSVLARRLFS